ncbi:MAG: nucleotidyltransferase family protein [Pseudonocardia sp.]
MDNAIKQGPPTLRELRERREAIMLVAQRHGAQDVRVFGSVARGDATAGSDVDFLVTMDAGRSLFDLGGLLMDLRDLLDGPVDVVTPSSLASRVRSRVLQEAVPL